MASEAPKFSTVSVGDEFSLTKEPVTTKQLVMYAGASGDYNRIHYDLPFAESAGLGGVIAHGMLTMGFLGQLVTDWIGPDGQVVEISSRFVKPVRPGDSCRLTGKVVEKSNDETDPVVTCELEGATDSGTVIKGRARVRLD